MSSSKNSNGNGTTGVITLKSFAELGNVPDLESLPPGPPDVDDHAVAATSDPLGSMAAIPETRAVEQLPSTPPMELDLASLIARLASVSSGLESMAREGCARPRTGNHRAGAV